MSMPTIKDFEDNTVTEYKPNIECVVCRCKKGFFSVWAQTVADAKRGAFNYFIQYWQDGEYAETDELRNQMLSNQYWEREK